MNCGSIRYNPKLGKYKITGIFMQELELFEQLLALWLENWKQENRANGGRFGDIQEFMIRGIHKAVQKQINRDLDLPTLRLEPAQVKVIAMTFPPTSHLTQLCDKARHSNEPLPLELHIQQSDIPFLASL
jgi:hypothetical protein